MITPISRSAQSGRNVSSAPWSSKEYRPARRKQSKSASSAHRWQVCHSFTQTTFAKPVPVERRRVEVPDACGEGHVHCALRRGLADGREEVAERRAAEAEPGDAELGAPELTCGQRPHAKAGDLMPPEAMIDEGIRPDNVLDRPECAVARGGDARNRRARPKSRSGRGPPGGPVEDAALERLRHV